MQQNKSERNILAKSDNHSANPEDIRCISTLVTSEINRTKQSKVFSAS